MVHVIGAGLAGSECVYALSRYNVKINLYEMKPEKMSDAHESENFAELVCSNSLKAMRENSAGGMLKKEMEHFGSLILKSAYKTKVPAGGALAVDRDKFSKTVTKEINKLRNVKVFKKEIKSFSDLEDYKNGDIIVIATGPLTSKYFTDFIINLVGQKKLSFYDAAAPIISAESIDMDKVFFAARYNRGEADYINCPFYEKEDYDNFINELINAETVTLKEFEKEGLTVFEGCMPVEVMAKRGHDTLRFGPLKPVGIYHPITDIRPYAVVQLRKENKESSLYNLVGFQTNLKFSEQKRIFSMIPGLEKANFVRYGVMHRNTFIDSPKILNNKLQMKEKKDVFFAGQITGVEGYMESTAMGLLVGENIGRLLSDEKMLDLPQETMMGALSNYVESGSQVDFQPMAANMGILPPLDVRIKGKQERYQEIFNRGMAKLIEITKR